MSDSVLLLITGLAAGVFAGMFGIGGGVVIVPALIFLFSFTLIQAVSTSLAALLLPVGIFAVISYHQKKLLDVKAAALLAFGLLATSIVGAQLALNLPVGVLQQLYGIFLLYMGWRFSEPRKVWREMQAKRNPNLPVSTKPEEKIITSALNDTPVYLLLAVGLMAGVFSGMFGIGGGAVIVPALVGFLHYDQKLAVGTSLGALLLPVGLPAVISYYNAGQLDLTVAAPVAIGLAFGGLAGAQIALRLSSKRVRRMYGIFLFFAGTWFIVRPLVETMLAQRGA